MRLILAVRAGFRHVGSVWPNRSAYFWRPPFFRP